MTLNVLDFGAIGNGTTDDSAAFAACFTEVVASGESVLIPKRTYLINSQLNISAGLYIESKGATLKHDASHNTIKILSAVNVDDWTINGKLTLLGTSSGTSQGIYISGCCRYMIDKIVCKNFNGTGMTVDTGTFSSAYRGDRGQINMAQFITNNVGLSIPALAEYNIFTNVVFVGNAIAFVVAGGNNIMNAANIIDNTAGVQMNAGTNHGHGIIGHSNINHNTSYNIQANSITQGYSINGCHIYASTSSTCPIDLESSSDIFFTGGIIDASVLANGTGFNGALGNIQPGTYFTIGGSNPTKFIRAYDLTSAAMNDQPSGSSGVTSVNGETGAITLVSGGATINITTPTSSTINLDCMASGGGTLTLISGATGTAIGDMTAYGGLAASFDGTTSKIETSCSWKTSGTSGWVGKTWSAAKTITKYEVWGSSDYGYDSTSSAETITIKLQGSNDAFASQIVDLHTISFSDTNTTNALSISSGITAGAYTSHRVFVSNGNGTANPSALAQIKFYETI